MNDTDPKIARYMREKIMTRSGEERFLMGIRMCEAARTMVMSSFPPGLSDVNRRLLLRRRYYSTEAAVTKQAD